MNDQPQPTPQDALAAIEDMYVRRMIGVFSVLCKQNGLLVSEHETMVAQCILATVGHELAQHGAALALKDMEEPQPLIVPGGGS